MSDNPYQTPSVEVLEAPPVPLTGAEAIRSEHLKHEGALKAVGFLFLVSAVLATLSLVIMPYGYELHASATWKDAVRLYWNTFGLVVVTCIGQYASGWGLRKLQPWAKYPAALLAGLLLIRLPVGPIVGAYVLYLLFCAKGRTVLSPAYAEIVAQTPHLRYRSPRWIWVAILIILLLLFGLAIFSPGMG